MISEKEKSIITDIASKYKVKKLFLFGSAVNSKDYNDIDLAVEGIRAQKYVKFFKELYFSLSKPVDLVDLSNKSESHKLIKRDAHLLYVQNS